MSTAAVMERELDVVSKALRETLSRLEDKVPSGRREEFDAEKSGALFALEESKKIIAAIKSESISIKRITDAPLLFDHINKLGSAPHANLSGDEKRLLLSARNESERFDRKRQLLRPSSEEEILQTLWWISQQGRNQDLDLLHFMKNSNPPRDKILKTLAWAEQEIIRRHDKEILKFFRFDSAQIMNLIRARIKQSQESAFLDQVAPNSDSPMQVIKQIEQIKHLLERLLLPHEIERWLTTGTERFGGKNPREMLLEGCTQALIDFLSESRTNAKEQKFRKRVAAMIFVLTSLFVLVGLIPLSGTVLGFGMAFGGALLAYESYLVFRAFSSKLAHRGH